MESTHQNKAHDECQPDRRQGHRNGDFDAPPDRFDAVSLPGRGGRTYGIREDDCYSGEQKAGSN
jgi:hypothetical protein